ncbi:DNA-directed RNA polymerase subunit beta [Striga asiatica]|uniref:DNA-directed RNA polymerase subunit beta n=1 Tax=Striga asiatica TaxID=4170 RepID=A0A5A7RKE5_STRAF|nr:DNA-directed RNA polymerase subunit beta [Striga asiatica]
MALGFIPNQLRIYRKNRVRKRISNLQRKIWDYRFSVEGTVGFADMYMLPEPRRQHQSHVGLNGQTGWHWSAGNVVNAWSCKIPKGWVSNCQSRKVVTETQKSKRS